MRSESDTKDKDEKDTGAGGGAREGEEEEEHTVVACLSATMLGEVALELQRGQRGPVGGGWGASTAASSADFEENKGYQVDQGQTHFQFQAHEGQKQQDIKGQGEGPHPQEPHDSQPHVITVRLMSSKTAAILLYVVAPVASVGVSVAGFVKLLSWAAAG